MVIWERTVMKHKLQSNDFLKNEIDEMKKKKDPSGLLFWCVYSVFYLFKAVLKLCRETLKSKRNHT